MASSTTNLPDGGVEALHALFESLGRGADNDKPTQISPEALQRLSDKLSEMTGPEIQRNNISGQLLNEEGLPIIEISEPVSDIDNAYGAGSILRDDPIVPISSLTEAQLDIRRRERDRILDQLEEEEEEKRVQEEQREVVKDKREYEKRKERVKDDLDKLKSAKAMQKKMGKALLRSLAEDREKETKKAPAASFPAEKRPATRPSKTVSFSEETKEADADVPSSRKHSRVDDKEVAIMQPTVIERTPSISTIRKPFSATPLSRSRSDQTRSTEPMKYATPLYSQSIEHGYSDSEDTSDTQVEDADSADEEFEFAREQRELALEYLERKQRMGAEFMNAMANPASPQEPDWNQENVPLDATLSHAPPKSSKSRFQSRLPPKSVIVPGSPIQDSIRYGKLDGDQLAGGPQGDSDDELPNEMDEILELLKKGNLDGVENIGPSGANEPPKLSRYDPSKPAPFKPVRVPKDSDSEVSPPGSRPETPTSHDARSSPKIPASPAMPDFTTTGPGPSALRNPITSTSSDVQRGSEDSGMGPDVTYMWDRPTPRARQPPTVLSAAVREVASSSSPNTAEEETPQKGKKLSRFKAARG